MGALDPQSLEVTTRLLTSRFDITCLLEKGEDIPILFSTRNRLEVWANSLSLELSPLYGKAGSNAVRVAGEFPFRKHSATMWVDFVWVRARWSRYRQALVKRARDAGEDTLCAYLHADHIVARRRLEHLPDAWVMLLEVPKHANSTFGSRIEKKLLPLPPTTVRYNLTGLELFKLYCEALPGGDGGTLEDTFQRVRAQFLSDERDALQFMMPMEQHVRSFLLR